MTTRQDIHVNQGETWSLVWTKRDASGAAVDLTGYTARMSVKDCINGTLRAYFSTGADANGGTIILGGAAGTVTLSQTSAQSAALANILSALSYIAADERSGLAGRPKFFDLSRPTITFRYDLELVSSVGVVTRELQGQFVVQREVTT